MGGQRDSNPNASGSEGLRGDMGVSSERSGPFGEPDPTNEGLEGTGSVGSSAERTDGTVDTSPAATEEHPEDGRRDALPPGSEGAGRLSSGIDRTVGEDNPAEVPSHENDRRKNPGHSHG